MGFFFGAIEESEAVIDFLLRIASFNFRAFVFLFCCLMFLKFFRGSAANRHVFISLALLATLLLPIVSKIAPSVDIVFDIPSPLAKSVDLFSGDVTKPEVTQANTAIEPGGFNFLADNLQLIFHALLTLYFLVGLSILAKVFISNFRICLTTMCAKVSYQNNWCRAIDYHRTRFWMSTHVELRHSHHINSPMTWGIINPVILVPSSALNWDDALIESTVLHELAHIKRGDWLTQQLAWCVCAIYWINPLSWRSLNCLHAHAETAADDMALRAGVKKSHYAENLLSVAKKICQHRTENYAALSMAAKGSELSTRITAILNPKGIHTPVSSKPLLLALALIFLFLLPLTSIQANYRQKIPLQITPPVSLDTSKDQNSKVSLSPEQEPTNDNPLTENSFSQFLNRPELQINGNNIGIVIPPSLARLDTAKPLLTTATDNTVAINTSTDNSLSEKQKEISEPETDAQVVESEILVDISQADALKIAGARLMQSIQGTNKLTPRATTLIATTERKNNKGLTNRFSQTAFPMRDEIPHAWNSFAQHSTGQSLSIEPSSKRETYDVVTALQPRSIVTPRYPNAARRRGIEGEVRVQFNVDKQGRVNQTTILAASPSGVFDRNVIRALNKSEFQPKTINGQAVSVEGIQEVYRFVLES